MATSLSSSSYHWDPQIRKSLRLGHQGPRAFPEWHLSLLSSRALGPAVAWD